MFKGVYSLYIMRKNKTLKKKCVYSLYIMRKNKTLKKKCGGTKRTRTVSRSASSVKRTSSASTSGFKRLTNKRPRGLSIMKHDNIVNQLGNLKIQHNSNPEIKQQLDKLITARKSYIDASEQDAQWAMMDHIDYYTREHMKSIYEELKNQGAIIPKNIKTNIFSTQSNYPEPVLISSLYPKNT